MDCFKSVCALCMLSRLREPSGPVIITGIGVSVIGTFMCNPPVDDARLEPDPVVKELLDASR